LAISEVRLYSVGRDGSKLRLRLILLVASRAKKTQSSEAQSCRSGTKQRRAGTVARVTDVRANLFNAQTRVRRQAAGVYKQNPAKRALHAHVSFS